SGNAGADIMFGGVGGDQIYGDRAAPTAASIANDGGDVILGDNGILDFSLDSDLNTLDLIRSFQDGLGGADTISGNAGGDVAIGGTGNDTIFGDDSAAGAGSADGSDILLGDNADMFLVARGGAGGGDLKLVLGSAGQTSRTADNEKPAPARGSAPLSRQARG